MCFSDCKQTTFFHLGRFLKKLADDQCFNVIYTIYHIKHMSLYTLLPFNGSIMLDICTYCVFTLLCQINNVFVA